MCMIVCAGCSGDPSRGGADPDRATIASTPDRRAAEEAEFARWQYPDNLKGSGRVGALPSDRTVIWHASTSDPIEKVLGFYDERMPALGLKPVEGNYGMSGDSTRPGRPAITFKQDAVSFSHKPGDPVVAENVFGVRTATRFETGFVCQEPRNGNTRIMVIFDALP
jgi:hypothetical protein